MGTGACSRRATTIALFANTSWYLWNFRRRLVRALIERGCAVVAIAPDVVYFERLTQLGARCRALSMTRAGTNPVAEMFVVTQLAQLLSRMKPDALLTFTPKANIYGGLVGRACRIPVINNISGLGRDGESRSTRALDLLVTRLYKAALKQSATVFFQNPDDRDRFLAAHLVETDRSGLLPGSGIDLDYYRAEPLDAERRPFTFLLAARLLWSKGVGDYVDAARQLLREEPRCRFLLLGFVDSDHPDAVPRRRIEEWARDGIVEFHESLDDVRPYLREAHCVVLPSVYREGTPRSLLEAAATARPVITTDRPGCRTVVEHGRTGFLCRPGDRRDLLGRMQAMRDMPAAALAAFGGEARRKMEREFDESIVLARYIDAVERILVSRNPARSPS